MSDSEDAFSDELLELAGATEKKRKSRQASGSGSAGAAGASAKKKRKAECVLLFSFFLIPFSDNVV